jgi:hypothetical protein
MGEISYLTLRKELRLMAFENKVSRRMFGQKKDEVSGDWRKLHNEELHKLYSSSSIITLVKSSRIRWAGRVTRMRTEMIDYRSFMGKPGVK